MGNPIWATGAYLSETFTGVGLYSVSSVQLSYSIASYHLKVWSPASGRVQIMNQPKAFSDSEAITRVDQAPAASRKFSP
jgi:hypothetical protein